MDPIARSAAQRVAQQAHIAGPNSTSIQIHSRADDREELMDDNSEGSGEPFEDKVTAQVAQPTPVAQRTPPAMPVVQNFNSSF